MSVNVVFLDYDGVVNIPIWRFDNDRKKWICNFNHPVHGKVNHFQGVQWVSEFCQKHKYDIVVTSTWRYSENCIECLRNGGLREGIEILGVTPSMPGAKRGGEISAWLKEHPEVDKYLIFDDDDDMTIHTDHLVRCKPCVGFTIEEFHKAEELDKKFSKEK